MSNKAGPKQNHPTKEQLLANLARKREVARKREIVVKQFYPALSDMAVSVDEAKMLIQAISSTVMETVLGWMQERQFAEIMPKMIERLAPNGERVEQVSKLLGTVENENIFVAKEIIEGMNRAIDQMIHEDMQTRKLDTLKPDWDKYLN